jgi:hypothetical protein
MRHMNIHQTNGRINQECDAQGDRCESRFGTSHQTCPGPRTQANPRLHQPKPSDEPSKSGSADHLPDIRNERGHYDEGRGVGRRHCQTEQADPDRGEGEASDPLDQSRKHKCNGNGMTVEKTAASASASRNAWKTRSLARSRRPAPSARETAEETPMPMPLLVVCSLHSITAETAPLTILVVNRGSRIKQSVSMRPVVSNWSASGCYKDFRGVEGVSDGGPEHARVAEPDEAKTSGSAVGPKSAGGGGHTGHRVWWCSSPRRLRPIPGSTPFAITFRLPSNATSPC